VESIVTSVDCFGIHVRKEFSECVSHYLFADFGICDMWWQVFGKLAS